MESNRIIPKGILFPFILLTALFFAWAMPNNLTDTMLAAFKRIMSISDSKTAWIQVVCYLLGYGCCAIPGALFIKKYTYKSGVMLGLGLYAFGALLFYPAMLCSGINIELSSISDLPLDPLIAPSWPFNRKLISTATLLCQYRSFIVCFASSNVICFWHSITWCNTEFSISTNRRSIVQPVFIWLYWALTLSIL